MSNRTKPHEALPDLNGHYGIYGGRFIPETLIPAANELDRVYRVVRKDPDFIKEFRKYLKHYVGRPTPLYHAE
ncbi:MAG: tryptophan synthase subunit beta, partial [Anaerolineae bacterium]|nr:tryptophan synthase subunit beta [Anaerolineae bacterium]